MNESQKCPAHGKTYLTRKSAESEKEGRKERERETANALSRWRKVIKATS